MRRRRRGAGSALCEVPVHAAREAVGAQFTIVIDINIIIIITIIIITITIISLRFLLLLLHDRRNIKDRVHRRFKQLLQLHRI